jgi:hypothetical protein
MKVYLPWLGEFGTELIEYVPRIFADPEEKIVCFERGKASIYSGNGRKVTVPRVKEKDRKCGGSLNQYEIWDGLRRRLGNGKEYIEADRTKLTGKRTFFVPNGKEFQFETDVVLFPRLRSTGKRRNWDDWPRLADALKAEGIRVFAAGHGDSSYRLNCHAAWDYCSRNQLDASIWAIKNSKLRVGTMTALTVLSLYCGRRPWVLTTPDGRLCERGRENERPNWRFLRLVDHLGAGFEEKRLLGDIPGIVNEIKRGLT